MIKVSSVTKTIDITASSTTGRVVIETKSVNRQVEVEVIKSGVFQNIYPDVDSAEITQMKNDIITNSTRTHDVDGGIIM